MLAHDPIDEARQQWIAQGWESAAPGLAVVSSLVRAGQIFVSRLEQELRPLGLSLARFEVLMQLLFSRHGSLPLGKMRVRLQVAPGAVTNVIDRLESDGLVARQTDATDARVTIARITREGRVRALKAVERVNEHVYEHMDMTTAEMEALFEQLKVIRERAGDFPAGS
jgi:DNA-binding MarR family transcriptional regulator